MRIPHPPVRWPWYVMVALAFLFVAIGANLHGFWQDFWLILAYVPALSAAYWVGENE